MKKPVIVLFAILLVMPLDSGFSKTGPHNLFSLSPQRIRDAIQYGRQSLYWVNEFGSYDLGLNQIDLGEGVGYVDIYTPFVEIATMARKMKNFGEDFLYDEAEKLKNYPAQIRAFLHVNKQFLKTRVDCLLMTTEEIFVLSHDAMESTLCDDSANKCVRLLIYFIPVDQIKNETHFTLVLKNLAFGQKKIRVNLTQIK